MLRSDDLKYTTTEIDGKWVIARPMKDVFIRRLKNAIKVLKGEAEAVVFYKQ